MGESIDIVRPIILLMGGQKIVISSGTARMNLSG